MEELFTYFIKLFTDTNVAVDWWVQFLGVWMYLGLFLVLFCETGLVVTPVLPGDSLLFAVGAVAVRPDTPLNLPLLMVLLMAAAILGDAVNYSIGYRLGPKVFKWEHGRFFNRHHLEKTQAFYDRYGGITIILARFVPFARTFAPFVAGIGQMQYRKFAIYNVVGAVAWVGLFLTAGALFGSHPIVQRNFKLVLVAIVVISLLPLLIGWLRNRSAAKVETAVVAPPPAPLEEGGERACA